MNKILLSAALTVLVSSSLFAQKPLSLYYLENIPQTTTINPARVPRTNAFFGVPLVNSIDIRLNTDFFGPDIIQNVDGRYVTLLDEDFNYNKLFDRIGKQSHFSMHQSISPLIMGFGGKKGYFTFTLSEIMTQTLAIPKDFFAIAGDGLPVGSTFDLSPLAMNAKYYREWSFGYSYNFMSTLRVGIHAKLLQGIAAIKTDFNTMQLDVGYQTDDNRHAYFDFDMNGDIYISAPIEIETDDDGAPSGMDTPDNMTDAIMKTAVFNFKNPGIAADIGVNYEYSSEWTFSGSLNDIGFIKWNGNLNTITANGSFYYDGIAIDGGKIDESDEVLSELMDSTKQGVNMKVGDKGFSTGLGPKIYLGAEYKVNHYFSAGALSRTMFIKNNFTQEFNISANLNLYHVLTTTLNYTLATSGASTFGFGLGLRGGPLQFYLVADYLPLAYRSLKITNSDGNSEPVEIPFTPTRFDSFNIMFGLNLLFGANGFRDEPMIDAYNEF